MTNDGGIARGVLVVDNISRESALAQALNMVRNVPVNQLTTQHLQEVVDRVQHPAGPSHTNIGDMISHGRDSAAHRRKTNNGLLAACVPYSMVDEQQVQAAMVANHTANMSEEQQLDVAKAANANASATNSPTGLTENEMLQFAILESKSSMTEAQLNSKIPAFSKGKALKISMPEGWPFPAPTTNKPKKRGAKRLIERLQSKNAEGYHSKLSKKKMTHKQKAERLKAAMTDTALKEKSISEEQMGESIARVVGIPMSQISHNVDRQIPDRDGDYFQSQDGLTQMRNILNIDSEDEEEEGKKEE